MREHIIILIAAASFFFGMMVGWQIHQVQTPVIQHRGKITATP